jgi:O-antigen ligase
MLGFVGAMSLSVPFTINQSLAFAGVQATLLNWTLIVGTAALVDTARRAEVLLIAYGTQFFWWTLWGTSAGLVPWHPTLSNYDTYGSWMVVGGGMCAFLALAASPVREYRWFRNLMIATVGLCAAGVVSSFARGAFLSAILVGVVVWLRSPRKRVVFVAGLACIAVTALAATLMYGPAYLQEMLTITQGTEESTGEDRWEMWQAAFGVFLTHPVIGVGFDNWGIFAASYYQPGDLGGLYAANPAIFYGKSTHNIYIQILAENGILGILAFAWILVDFWRRNAQLRTTAAIQRWKALGGRLDLRVTSLSLEAAMVGWMADAFFYSMAGLHWFYTLLASNLLLHTLVRVGLPEPARRNRRFLGVNSSTSGAGGGLGARR